MFKVGNFVLCIKEYDGNYHTINKIGKIIRISVDGDVDIEYLKEFYGGHSANGRGVDGRCWRYHFEPHKFLKNIKTNKK